MYHDRVDGEGDKEREKKREKKREEEREKEREEEREKGREKGREGERKYVGGVVSARSRDGRRDEEGRASARYNGGPAVRYIFGACERDGENSGSKPTSTGGRGTDSGG